MKFIGRVLKEMDYSSVNYYFHINNNESFRTKFGGLLYLCYFIFFFYFGIKLSLDFLLKLNYSIIFIEKIIPTPPELPLQNYNLSFAFSVNYDNNSLLEDEVLKKYLVEKVYFVTMRNSTNKTKKEIKFKPCEKKELYTKYNNPEIDYSQFSKWRCLADRNFTLQGGFNDDLFQYIEYAVFLNYTTFSSEKMTLTNNFFGKTLINVVVKYFEMGIDVDNYEQPLRTYDYNIFDYVSISKVKKVNLDFSRYEFQNDAHILFGEPESESFLRLGSEYGYSYDMYDRSPNVNDYNVLFKYYIRSSSNVSIVKRGYQKLWDLLANIGGLVGQILFCIVFINTFYNKFKSREELVNNLLKFKDNYYVNNKTFNQIKKIQDDYIKIISERKNSLLDVNDYDREMNRSKHRINKMNPNENNYNNSNYDNFEVSKMGLNEAFEFEKPEENEISQNEKVMSNSSNKNYHTNVGLNKNINNNNKLNEYNNNETHYNVSSNQLMKNNIGKSPNNETVFGKDFCLSNNNDEIVVKKNLFSSFLKKNKRKLKMQNDSSNKQNSYNGDDSNNKSKYLPNSKNYLVKVDTSKGSLSGWCNKDKDKIDVENIKIEVKEGLEQKPAKVSFFNNNLNLLKNSIFSKHSKFLLRKLNSVKDVSRINDGVKENDDNVNSNFNENNDNNRNDFNNVNNDYINNFNKNENEINDENDLNHISIQKESKQQSSYQDIKIKVNIAEEENKKREEEEKEENIKKSEENLNSLSLDEDEFDERRNDKNLVYSFAGNANMNDNFYSRLNNAKNKDNFLNSEDVQQQIKEEIILGDISYKKFLFNGLDNFLINQDPRAEDRSQAIKNPTIQNNDPIREQKETKVTELNSKAKILFKNAQNFDSVSYRTNNVMLEAAYQSNQSNSEEPQNKNLFFDNMKNVNENEIYIGHNSNEKNSKNISNFTKASKGENIRNNLEKERENQNSPKTKYQDIRSIINIDLNSVKPKIDFFMDNNVHLLNDITNKATGKQKKKEKKINFDFSVFDIFCRCLCFFKSKQSKFQLYKRSYKSINEHLNIFFYLKLIQEIEVIKSLVFSYEQIGLINFVSKPMIFNEVNYNMKMNAKQIKQIFKEESSLDNALEFFRDIINQRKFNDIDHKLIKIFLYEFESIIDYDRKFASDA